MPQGGQINLGAGLRLQRATPGVSDVGNFHITGTGIANTFLASYGGYGDTGSAFGTALVLGNYGTMRLVGGGAIVNNTTAVGNGITLGSIAGYGTTSTNEQTLIGGSVSSGSRGNVVIGAAATSDAAAGPGGASVGFAVVIGRAGASTSDFANNRGLNVTIGANNLVSGGCIVSVGGGQQITNKTGAGVKGGIYLGQYVTSTAGTNQIILDSSSTGAAALPDETRSNLIKIGDSTHTIVEIAGKNFAAVGGTSRLVADVNATVAATDAALLYSSITAARTVALPAANAVPIGFSVLIADQSGSASGVNTITINRAGADTINGGASAVINTAFGVKELISDGASKWTIIRSL